MSPRRLGPISFRTTELWGISPARPRPENRSLAVQLSQKRVARPKLDVERVELPNGLVLLLSENHSIPSVSINTILRTGSRFESDDNAGLASLTGALLDSGTTSQTSQQIAET